MTNEVLRTPAWLLIGLGNVPGVLELADGRLGFTTEEGRVFEAPLSQINDLKFPWYYFGGGMKLRVGNEKYRVSFVRPNGASDVPGHLFARTDILGAAGDVVGLLTAGRKFLDVGQGRRAGKAWKSVLAAQLAA